MHNSPFALVPSVAALAFAPAAAHAYTVTQESASATLLVSADAPSSGTGDSSSDNRFDSSTALDPAFDFSDSITASAVVTPGPPTPGGTPGGSAGSGNASGDASLTLAANVVDFDPNELGFVVIYDASTSALNNGDARGTGFAAATFSARFILDQPADYYFQAILSFDPNYDREFTYALRNTADPNNPLISIDPNDTDTILTGTLQPGEYRLDFDASQESIANDFGGTGFASQDNTLDLVVVFTPVPEPGSLALLAMGGLLITRRRRG